MTGPSETSPFFFLSLLFILVVISGCTQSFLTPVSQQDNLYEIVREESFISLNSDSLLPKAIEEASQYCASADRFIEILSAEETPESFLLGTRYKATVQFKCLQE